MLAEDITRQKTGGMFEKIPFCPPVFDAMQNTVSNNKH